MQINQFSDLYDILMAINRIDDGRSMWKSKKWSKKQSVGTHVVVRDFGWTLAKILFRDFKNFIKASWCGGQKFYSVSSF